MSLMLSLLLSCIVVHIMWLTVRMVLYLTESHMPSKVFVMGQNSISGQCVISPGLSGKNLSRMRIVE
jgi:hypothetical protein